MITNSECPQVQTDRGGHFGCHLVIVHWTKLIFKHGREFDNSNLCMNFGGNLVIND